MATPYYVVFIGRTRGIFATWNECEKQVKGYSGAKQQKYGSLREAQQAWSAFIGKPIGDTTPAAKPDSISITSGGRTLRFPIDDDLRGFLDNRGLLP